MFITLEKLRDLSKTAKIKIEKTEEEFLLKVLNEEFEPLNAVLEVDTKNYAPMINPNNDEELEKHKDEVSDGDKTEELMKNAPSSLYNYFAVPKVIKKDGGNS